MPYRNVVGNRLRALRKEQGLTLAALAQKTSLSASFLSQIERGASQPSISSLTTICNTLGVDLPSILIGLCEEAHGASSPSMVLVTRQQDALEITIGQSDVKYEYLSGAFPGRVMEILLNRFPPNYRSDHKPHRREEFGYVLRGPLSVTIGNETYTLESGDTYHFPSALPHSYVTGEDGADVLIASTERFLDWGHRVK